MTDHPSAAVGEREEALGALIQRARSRAARLSALSDDPYAGGTEREDARLFEQLTEALAGGRTPQDDEVIGAFRLLYSDMVDLDNFKAVKVVGAADLVATRVRQFRALDQRLSPPGAKPRTALQRCEACNRPLNEGDYDRIFGMCAEDQKTK